MSQKIAKQFDQTFLKFYAGACGGYRGEHQKISVLKQRVVEVLFQFRSVFG